jgi:hypothetical protein
MKIIKLFYTLSIVNFLANNAFSQNNNDIPKSINIDKLAEGNSNEISAESVKKSINEIFSPSKLTSLMFNDEQYGNIEKAIESARNNIEFVPEGEEAKKLSEEEAKKQKEEMETIQKNEDNEKSYIYLSSIMFFSENSWSLWINDKKYVANNNKPDAELYFKNVSQDKVTIIWKLSISKWKILSGKKSEELAPKINKDNQVEITFEIKPNQTFILNSSKTVDGKISDYQKRR